MRPRSRTRFARSCSRRTSMPSQRRSCQSSRTDMNTATREQIDQARTIGRATFDGFLQSDLMPTGMQAPALIWAAAFMVGPALFLPAQYMVKYPFMRRFHPERLERAFWNDRTVFLFFFSGRD